MRAIKEQRQEEKVLAMRIRSEISEFDVVYNYTCPKCGGTIIAYKASGDGRLLIKCDNCDLTEKTVLPQLQ